MSAALNFDISGTVVADLLQLERGLGGGTSLRQQMGGEVQRLTQDHLRQANLDKPNELGGVRTNFYAKAAQATFFELAPDGLDLNIAMQGIRQRIEGGVIRPVNSKWLAIPVVPEAHGHRPGEFPNLQFVPINAALALLVAKEGGQAGRTQRIKNGKIRNVKSVVEEGKTMFVLKKEVHQVGDRSILPSDQQYEDALDRAVTDWVSTIGSRN